jgi:hypothetical protein
MKPGQIIYNGQREWRLGSAAPVYEDLIAWTSNGGTDWQKNVSPSGPGVFIPIDSNRWGGFDPAYNYHDPAFPPNCSFRLSTDRGENWRNTGVWDGVLGTNCEFWDSRRGIVYGDLWYASYQGHWDAYSDSGSYVTYDGGETWEQWHRVCDIFTARLIGDSVLYCVMKTRRDSWEFRQSGPLVRCPRWDPVNHRSFIIDRDVTALSAAGEKLFLLLLDGRLMVIDQDVVGIRQTPAATSEFDFVISPNPARNVITISRRGSLEHSETFELYNAAGIRALGETDITLQPWESQRSIALASLPAGSYFVIPYSIRARVHGFTLLK